MSTRGLWMLNLRYGVFLALVISACSNAQEQATPDIITERPKVSSEVCSIPSLEKVSNKFLTALNDKDVIYTKSVYSPDTLSEGVSTGVTYTFFPKSENTAFFNFPEKNQESPFEAHVLGEYDDGYLVTFIQEQHRSLSRDPDFLTYRKFDGFFACFFQCIEVEWKITKYSCFENSGGPFFAPEESNFEE